MASRTERLQVYGYDIFPTLLEDSDVEYDRNPYGQSDDIELSKEELEEVADYFDEDAKEAARELVEEEAQGGKATLVSVDYNEREKTMLNDTARELGVSIEWTTPEQDAEILKLRAEKSEAARRAEETRHTEAQTKILGLRQKWIDRARYLLAEGSTKEEVRQAVIMSGEDTGYPHPQIIYTLRQLGLVPSKNKIRVASK